MSRRLLCSEMFEIEITTLLLHRTFQGSNIYMYSASRNYSARQLIQLHHKSENTSAATRYWPCFFLCCHGAPLRLSCASVPPGQFTRGDLHRTIRKQFPDGHWTCIWSSQLCTKTEFGGPSVPHATIILNLFISHGDPIGDRRIGWNPIDVGRSWASPQFTMNKDCANPQVDRRPNMLIFLMTRAAHIGIFLVEVFEVLPSSTMRSLVKWDIRSSFPEPLPKFPDVSHQMSPPKCSPDGPNSPQRWCQMIPDDMFPDHPRWS